MIIYLGADHRGFDLKEQIKAFLRNEAYEVKDLGAVSLDQNDDYVDYAARVASSVARDPENTRGILVCGSGVGMDVTANRFFNIRSALAMSPDHAMVSRNEDDTNVLSLGADFTDIEMAKKIVSVWMQTPFLNEERYKRRIDKINNLANSSN